MSGGCRWKPFEIDETQYAALVEELRRRGSFRVLPEPPSWVKTREDWSIWLDEHDEGVPAEEHRRLAAEAKAAHQAYLDSHEEAVQKRDPLLPVRRWHASLSAARAVADLRAGRPIGSSGEVMDTELDRLARRASDAQKAMTAAERIGDERLIEKWRSEVSAAEEALKTVVPKDDQAAAAKALANAIERS